jgi:hypothetical protein
MKIPTAKIILEVVDIIIVRIACVTLCLFFFFPMVKTSITYLSSDLLSESYTLNGFDMIFGVFGSNIYGNPFALIIFIFPIVILMISFMDFLGDHVHTAILVLSIIGAVLSIVFFISVLFTLSGKTNLFDMTLYEMRSSLSWGVLPIFGIYIFIIVLAIIGKKMNSD